MSYARWSRQTDENQKTIVRDLRALPGVTVEIIGQPVDLAVGYRGRTYLVEIKNLKGKGKTYTPAQERFFERWTGGYLVATEIDEILDLIGFLRLDVSKTSAILRG